MLKLTAFVVLLYLTMFVVKAKRLQQLHPKPNHLVLPRGIYLSINKCEVYFIQNKGDPSTFLTIDEWFDGDAGSKEEACMFEQHINSNPAFTSHLPKLGRSIRRYLLKFEPLLLKNYYLARKGIKGNRAVDTKYKILQPKEYIKKVNRDEGFIEEM